MDNLRDKYILGFGVLLLCYLGIRWLNYGMSGILSTFDFHVIFLFMLSIWYIVYNYRRFTMTIKRLSKFNMDNHLEYCRYVLLNGGGESIYVRVLEYGYPSEWYELDYPLTISRHCSENRFNDFANTYDTVEKLYGKMSESLTDKKLFCDYHSMCYEYNCYRWLSFSFLLLSYFVICLVIFS